MKLVFILNPNQKEKTTSTVSIDHWVRSHAVSVLNESWANAKNDKAYIQACSKLRIAACSTVSQARKIGVDDDVKVFAFSPLTGETLEAVFWFMKKAETSRRHKVEVLI